MARTSSPLITVFEDYKGLVHRAVHVVPVPGGYYGEADCDPYLVGAVVYASELPPLTCVRCLVIR